MDKENIKQGFANELVATLNVVNRHFKIEYDRKNDTFELLEKYKDFDYVLSTGDIFKVVDYLLSIYDTNV